MIIQPHLWCNDWRARLKGDRSWVRTTVEESQKPLST